MQWNFNQYSHISIQENAFENVVSKMVAILSQFQWINTFSFSRDTMTVIESDILLPYGEYQHGPQHHTHRHIRSIMQTFKFGSSAHEIFPNHQSYFVELPIVESHAFVEKIGDYYWDQRHVYGHIYRINNPHETVSILEPGKRGGCDKNYMTTVEETARNAKCIVATNAGFFNTTSGACLGEYLLRKWGQLTLASFWYLIRHHIVTSGLVSKAPLWCHQMETSSTSLALCEGNPPVTDGFPLQRPVMWSFYVFFDCAWTNSWANKWDAGDLRRHHAHYDFIGMTRLGVWTTGNLWLWNGKCERCLRSSAVEPAVKLQNELTFLNSNLADSGVWDFIIWMASCATLRMPQATIEGLLNCSSENLSFS